MFKGFIYLLFSLCRTIVFSPEVLITVDYHGKRVEMSNGPLTGLIMGLGQLQCTEIRLKEIRYR